MTDARVRREAETVARDAGCRVMVIALKRDDVARELLLNGVHLVEANVKKYDGKLKYRYVLSYLHFVVSCFYFCTKRYLQKKVDVVHIHNMPDFLVFSAIIPRLFGRNVILDIHDSMPETYAAKYTETSPILFWLLCLEERVSACFSNKVICVNHVQKNVLVNRGIPAAKILVLLNSPDPKIFRVNSGPRKTLKRSNGFKIVYHGTIARRLGVDIVVEAFARLTEIIPGIEFHIWSKSGDEIDSIERLSQMLGVHEKVHLLKGGMPLEELPEGLATMDLGVIGNRKDLATELMLPVKMLEYIAMGIPVVVPNLKTIEHYFNADMVSFYEAENVDSMADAIYALYKDEHKRLRQADTATGFLRQYGWQKHKFELVEWYCNLDRKGFRSAAN